MNQKSWTFKFYLLHQLLVNCLSQVILIFYMLWIAKKITIALVTGLNTRAFGNQILSILWKFWYFEWHLNESKLCYACCMHCLTCHTIRFFHEVSDTMHYTFLAFLHMFFIFLVKSVFLVVVSFWYYDIVLMVQNSWTVDVKVMVCL